MTLVCSLKHGFKRLRFANHINSVLRSRIQERQARLIRLRYARAVRAKGVDSILPTDLKLALRKRLASRAARRGWPKHKGGLHLFLAFATTNWEAVLGHAFIPFGRVTVFDWRAQGFDDRAKDWLSRRDAMNQAMLAAFRDANQRDPVDAVVGYLSGFNTAPDTLAIMADDGAAIFNFSFDDKLEFPGPVIGGRYTGPAALAEVVDLHLTSDPDAVVRYVVHGGFAMFHPPAADPMVYRPYEGSFEYDVSFIGAKYGWRPRFMTALARRGIRVACFGDGWKDGPVPLEDMARIYSRSRINVGFAGIGHSRRLMCLKGRDFEVPMSGGLYLTQHNPELALVYDVGSEIVTYTDEADCARMIRRLLDNPAEAAQIRTAGRMRALKDHTYEARWSKVFRVTGLIDT